MEEKKIKEKQDWWLLDVTRSPSGGQAEERLTVVITSLIWYPESISRWSSGPSLLQLPLLVGQHPLGLSLSLGLWGDLTELGLRGTCTAPADILLKRTGRIYVYILWDKASQSALVLPWAPKNTHQFNHCQKIRQGLSERRLALMA